MLDKEDIIAFVALIIWCVFLILIGGIFSYGH